MMRTIVNADVFKPHSSCIKRAATHWLLKRSSHKVGVTSVFDTPERGGGSSGRRRGRRADMFVHDCN